MVKYPHQAYCLSTLPHQKKISDEGMLDQTCLGIAGRTLDLYISIRNHYNF